MRSNENEVDRELLGGLFENMMVAELHKQNVHRLLLREFFFWRDSNGNECDLLTPVGNRFDVWEIKSGLTIYPKHFQGMEVFDTASGGKVRHKTLIYGGLDNQDRTVYRVRGWKNCGE